MEKAQSSESSSSEEKFKKGDYSVHIFLEESKGLLPSSSDRSFNPVISIKCFDKIKCTRKLKDITTSATSLWNEHIYFSKLGCSITELETSKILIEVLDSRSFKNNLIGSYELDFTYVYFQPKHSIIHQWIILSNPYSEDVTIQRGLIKLGVNILHETDKAEDLTAKGQAESMIIPPQVNVKSMQLVIRILQAMNLPKMDSGSGTCDAYCVASFATTKNKTKIDTADKATMSASWYQDLWLPVCQPSISNKISITLWDHDTLGDDELIGSLNFHWDKIPDESQFLQDPNNSYFWANIYGAPDGLSNEKAIEMNCNEKLASHWRGRILMGIFKRDAEKALLKVQSADTPELKQLVQSEYEVEVEEFQVSVQALEAVNLPFPSGAFSIMVKFSGLEMTSKPVEALKGCCKWYENIKRKIVGLQKGAVTPDTFIYLMYDKQPICFCRLKPQDLADPRPKEKWFKLTPDSAVGKVTNLWEGGYVLMKIFVGKNEDYDKKFWETKIDYSQKFTNKLLVCNLYQCRNLPSADVTGLADPYVKVLCGSSDFLTDKQAKEGILNPVWYESRSMQVLVGPKEISPPVIVQVWDYDGGSSDEIMGYCTIDMSTIPLNPPDAPRPAWHKLSLGTKDSEEGEILLSFMLVDVEPPPFILPALIEVNIEIYALGFRNLKPALGWLPVNKAFLKVDVRAAQLPGEQSLITELSTQPNNQGPNPNIGSVLSFKTKIPADVLFCPNISCTVHDFLMSGRSQPILGTFDLNLHNVYAKGVSEIVPKKAQDVILHKMMKSIDDSNNKNLEEGKEAQEEKRRASFSEIPMSLTEAQTPGFVVVYPQYKPRASNPTKKVEVKFSNKNYMAIGYNREAEDGKKHYRYILSTTLEKSQLFGDPPFNIFPIKKGQIRGDTSGFSFFGKKNAENVPTLTDAGVFKGIVRIKNTAKTIQNQDDGFENIAKLLLIKTNCIVRVYIIDALDLEQMDVNSASDPYIIVKLGGQKISDRDNYQEDQPCPKFNKHFDLSTTFPGDSTLKLQVWDHNGMFADNKIGTLKIDLEDRFFNENWKKISDKPIETGKLTVKSSKQPKGYIRYWVEIHPSNSVPRPFDLSLKPAEEYELRIIIWKSEQVPNMDVEGVSDLYLVADLNNTEKKETDTHYRAQNGEASWNWRMKFKLMLDESSKVILNLSLWDRDLLSSNDAIGGACLDLTDLAMYAVETGDRVKKYGKSERFSERVARMESEKFFVDFTNMDQTGKENFVGKVLISAEILPAQKAKSCMNAEGRAEPNIEPKLPPPDGRMELSMNPVKMLADSVGPELKRKIKIYALVLCCTVVCLMMFPMLVANGFSKVLFF